MDKKHSSRWIKWLAAGFVLVIGLSVALGLILRKSSSPTLLAKLDAIKKAGHLTFDDLDRMYPPLPVAENSAAVYSNAFLKLARTPANVTGWPVLEKSLAVFRTNPLPPEIKQGIADYIEKNADALNLLHQAALIENGFYANGFSDGMFSRVRLPFVEIRQSAQILALAAISHAEAGKPDLAVQSIIDSLGVPRSLKQSPLLVSQMIRSGTLGLSCATLELVLNKNTLSTEQLANLTTAFDAVGPTADFERALVVDRCRGIAGFEMLKDPKAPSRETTFRGMLGAIWNRLFHYRESDYVFYLDTMEQWIGASKEPFPKRLDDVRELAQKLRLQNPTTNRLGGIFFFDYDNAFVTDAKKYSELALSRTALGIERYRLANQNQLPGALQDLVPAFLPAVPADPFDGQPVRYKKLDMGYVVYSVDEDRADNGGREPPPDPSTNAPPSDITFTVGR